MTNQQILEHAITKAIDGGWGPLPGWELFLIHDVDNIEFEYWQQIDEFDTDRAFKTFSFNDIIFSHDFAKALWGEQPNYHYGIKFDGLATYQIHLQKMVIADNPIAYLGENI